MMEILNYLFGLAMIAVLILIYAFSTTAIKYQRAKDKQIKEDVAEFGQCCGLEGGVCTFKPRLEKLNKIDLDAAKKEK